MIFCSRPSLFWGTARTPLLLLFVVNFFCRTKNSTIVWLWSSSPSHSELSKKFPKVSKNRLLEMNKNNFTLIRQKIWAFKNLYPEANEWFKIQLCKNCSKELQQRKTQMWQTILVISLTAAKEAFLRSQQIEKGFCRKSSKSVSNKKWRFQRKFLHRQQVTHSTVSTWVRFSLIVTIDGQI